MKIISEEVYRCPHGKQLFEYCLECTAQEVNKIESLPDGYGEIEQEENEED